ncbi:hypothetical protein A3K86_22380 [Photobacterium jeanii]|uniref:Uncharacterized protein n=1 Tax=Photobacterium jeanii TaxID=858640 RepID=A0A178K4J8_9GAMM|nr:DUF6796 family protein [Photobacterium jeanii]OAN11664.1 hypothetical protein A3K86_22380 [Photobacterium jeanii]PST91187.1 hypothetical protein C9I91_11495 [Photobacterium jeanii]
MDHLQRNSEFDENNQILLGINIVVISAILNLFCDLILYYGPSDGAVISDMYRLIPALGETSDLRVKVGAGLSVVLVSCWFFALPALCCLMAPFKRLRFIALISYTVFIGTCVAFHSSFGFLAIFGNLVSSGDLELKAAISQVNDFSIFIQIPMFLSLIVFSLIFGFIAFSQATNLPKWSVILSPIIGCTALPFLASLMPSPFGAAVAIIASTFGLLIFFTYIRWCFLNQRYR